jgi:hypothetical protein
VFLLDKRLSFKKQVYQQKGSENLADYFTKHHPASHHQHVRSHYLRKKEQPQQQMAHTQWNNTIAMLNKQQLDWLSEPHCEGVLENNNSPVQGNYINSLTSQSFPHYSET